MNKDQRKQVAEVVAKLGGIIEMIDEEPDSYVQEAVQAILDDAESEINGIKEDEEYKLDNMSDGLKAGPTGEAIQNAIDIIDGITWPLAPEGINDTFGDEVQAVIDELEQL